ncbi:MAG: chain length determinant protein tyrosine kinase EpsG [Oxalobacteraceae bacterium]|nr:chain length determinant protein tyrosine kinase EpsG [Oxalobacteraceae bacterium]
MIDPNAPVKASTVLEFSGKEAADSSHRSIGAILIEAGRLSADNAEKILRLQREHGQRFGETAVGLGLLTQADVELGLSRQFDFPYLLKGQSQASHELVAAYDPFSTQVEALRALRSQLMLRWFDSAEKHTSLAITSPERNEGRSFLAANLAVVFSQLGERTLLIDADMRNPRQHALFGLPNRNGLSAILSGRSNIDAITRIPSMIDLSVLSAGVVPPNPQELLARPVFQQLLQELERRYDVILIDTPATDVCADAQSVAIRTGAALVVARKNVSRIRAVHNLVDSMKQSRVCVVGSVLNEF